MRRFWLTFVNAMCIFMQEEFRSWRQMRKNHKRGCLDGSVTKAQKRHTEWCVSPQSSCKSRRTDSLFCGKATAGQTVHRTVCLDRPFESVAKAQKRHTEWCVSFVVGEDGFEPSKRYAADLQSVPFGHSGTPPYSIFLFVWLEPVDGLEPPTY